MMTAKNADKNHKKTAPEGAAFLWVLNYFFLATFFAGFLAAAFLATTFFAGFLTAAFFTATFFTVFLTAILLS